MQVDSSLTSLIPESAPHMDHDIPFGIFQICREENPALVAPVSQKVVTNSGKLRGIPRATLLFFSPSPSRVGLAVGCRSRRLFSLISHNLLVATGLF